jgi:hypothetical protein
MSGKKTLIRLPAQHALSNAIQSKWNSKSQARPMKAATGQGQRIKPGWSQEGPVTSDQGKRRLICRFLCVNQESMDWKNHFDSCSPKFWPWCLSVEFTCMVGGVVAEGSRSCLLKVVCLYRETRCHFLASATSCFKRKIHLDLTSS